MMRKDLEIAARSARGFMPHDEGRYSPAGGTVKAVDVAPTNAAGLDLHQYIMLAHLRLGHVGDAQLFMFL